MICNVAAEIPFNNQSFFYYNLIDQLDVLEILRYYWNLPYEWCVLLDPDWLPF